MPASISTRLDEQEFLELADCYYIAPRHAMADNASRTGSTTTISTNNTCLGRRITTVTPSTFKECGLASGEMDDFHQYDIVEGQTLSHIVIDPQDSLKTPTSMSLESCPDDMQTFRKATGHDDLGKPKVGSLNTVPPRIQMQQIDPAVRSHPSFPTNFSRSISTTSLTHGTCFSIICIPRWKGSGRGFRPRKPKKNQATQSIDLVTRETSGPIPIRSFDACQLGEEYLVSLPSRGLASASSLGLDYDYQHAVEVLVNGSVVGP